MNGWKTWNYLSTRDIDLVVVVGVTDLQRPRILSLSATPEICSDDGYQPRQKRGLCHLIKRANACRVDWQTTTLTSI
jgi:hypothetical protein